MIRLVEEELSDKVQTKLDQIEKRKQLIEKLESKLSSLEQSGASRWDIETLQSDLRTSRNKLKELENQLSTLQQRNEKKIKQDSLPNIPIIHEFLDNWEAEAISWHEKDYVKYKEYRAKIYQKKEEFSEWCRQNGVPPYSDRGKEKQVELKIDSRGVSNYVKQVFSSLTIMASQYGNQWKEFIVKEIAKEKKSKYIHLVQSVMQKAGNIVDASHLYIGDNGDINGFIIGDKAKVEVTTISAGGYNIQRFHYRVLIRPIN